MLRAFAQTIRTHAVPILFGAAAGVILSAPLLPSRWPITAVNEPLYLRVPLGATLIVLGVLYEWTIHAERRIQREYDRHQAVLDDLKTIEDLETRDEQPPGHHSPDDQSPPAHDSRSTADSHPQTRTQSQPDPRDESEP